MQEVFTFVGRFDLPVHPLLTPLTIARRILVLLERIPRVCEALPWSRDDVAYRTSIARGQGLGIRQFARMPGLAGHTGAESQGQFSKACARWFNHLEGRAGDRVVYPGR